MKNKVSLIGKIQRVFVLVFFGLLPLGQLERIQVTPTIAFYLHDLVLGMLIAFWLVDKKKRISLRLAQIVGAIVPFVGVASASLMLNVFNLGADGLTAALHLVRLMMFFSLLVILPDLRYRNIVSISLHKLLAFVGIGLTLGGAVQYWLVPDTTMLVNYGWDDHYYRVIGTLFDPNFLGLMMLLTMLLLLKKGLKIKGQDFLLVGSFFVLSLTYSRSTYVAVAGVLAGWAFLERRLLKLIRYLVMFTLFVIFLPYKGGAGTNLLRIESISQRLESQKAAIEVWKKRPVMGVGFNAYPIYAKSEVKYDYMPRHPSAPDNSYLFVLATTGMIGLSTFGYFWWKVYNELTPKRVLFSSLLAVGIHSLFNNSLFFPWVMIWLMALLAEEVVSPTVDI